MNVPIDMPMPQTPARGVPVVAVAALVGLAFFLTQHSILTSVLDAYGTTQEELSADAARGNLSSQVGFSLLGLTGIILLNIKGGWPWAPRGLLPFLIVFILGWCLLSSGWSSEPMLTFKRSAILALCFLAALGLAKHLDARRLCLLALAVTTAYAALGLGAELALGAFRPGGFEYRFAGTLHPNGQGGNCALLCLSAACLLRGQRRWWWLLLVGLIVFAAGLMYLTKSRTAAAGLVAGLVVVQCLRPTPRFLWLVLAAVMASSGAVLLAELQGFELQRRVTNAVLMGRVEHAGSLTGRTDLWAALVPYILARPLLGYGYGGFWNAERIAELSHALNWGMNSAHSAYLDMFLSVGAVGAAALALIVAGGLARCGGLYRRAGAAGHGLTCGLLAYGLLESFAESNFLLPSFVTFTVGCGLCRVAFFRDVEPTRADVPRAESVMAGRGFAARRHQNGTLQTTTEGHRAGAG